MTCSGSYRYFRCCPVCGPNHLLHRRLLPEINIPPLSFKEPGNQIWEWHTQELQHLSVYSIFSLAILTSFLSHFHDTWRTPEIISPVQDRVSGCMLSRVWLFATPQTVAHQAPLSTGFPRQENWVGCHFLLQGIFLTQGSNPHLLHCWGTREPHPTVIPLLSLLLKEKYSKIQVRMILNQL